MLQKTSQKSSNETNKAHFERRFKLWKDGNITTLVSECIEIQRRLRKNNNNTRNAEYLSKTFSHFIKTGNINRALRLLSENPDCGVLDLTDDALEGLKLKHPTASPKFDNLLLNGPVKIVHEIVFDDINEELIQKAAIRTKGAAGPSKFDADDWRCILGSNIFGKHGAELRKSLARMTKVMCASEVSKKGSLEAFLACQLIPLNKSPGIRPIGIGEVLRRIMGKTVMMVLKKDVIHLAGALQVCAGQQAGVESAIHSMVDLFESDTTSAIIQIDATNAFNSLNRKVFLYNIKIICPELTNFVYNYYTSSSRLFVRGGKEISSEEGTTQGDPIAIRLYALGITPLLNCASRIITSMPQEDSVTNQFHQVAFADDFTGCGKLDSLREWFDEIVRLGPYIGYYVNPKKSWLVVKNSCMAKAKNSFSGTGINITNEGRRHLGGVIGSSENKNTYINNKIDEWCKEIEVLSKIATSEPHAAYAAFVFGLRHRYTFFMRTIPNISTNLQRLENKIRYCFIKTLLNGYECTDLERELFELPAKFGGLGLINPSKISNNVYQHSRKISEEGSTLIKKQQDIYTVDEYKINNIKAEIKSQNTKDHENKLNEIKAQQSDQNKIKVINASTEPTAYNWLTTIPLVEHGFHLEKNVFWDSIRVRYNIPLKYLPSRCACGAIFNLEHAFSCKKGGFIPLRHNELRDFAAQQLTEVCNDVKLEPQLKPLSGEVFHHHTDNITDDARVDISARTFQPAATNRKA